MPKSAYNRYIGGFLIQEIAKLFQALADETRLRLIKLLDAAESGVCVCELVDASQVPQYQVSRHLAVLKTSGLVSDSKEGTWVYYKLRRDLPAPLAPVIAALREITDEISREDQERLQARLKLRVAGRCVIGYVTPLRAKTNQKQGSDPHRCSEGQTNKSGSIW